MLSRMTGQCHQSISIASWYSVPLAAAKQLKINPTTVRGFSISKKKYQKPPQSKLSSNTPILDGLRLSSEEAFQYLRHTLGIVSADTKLGRDRFGLLREITLQSHCRIPFQNVTNTYSIPVSERRIPSFGDIKHAMLTGQGGVCYDLNIFTNRLLHALGYNVNLIGGSFMGHDRYHVTNVVHDAEVKGQRHLVEVGASDPTFCPIPLDFEKESPMYQDSYLTYRFERSPCRNSLHRLHLADDNNTDASLFDDNDHLTKWRLISEIDVDTIRDLDYFTEPMSYVFNALPRPNLKLFSSGMYAMIYKNGKMAYIRDNHCYLEINGDSIEHRVMYSPEEMLEAYSKHMPMIPQERVLMGLKDRNLVFPDKDEIKPISLYPIVRYKNVVI